MNPVKKLQKYNDIIIYGEGKIGRRTLEALSSDHILCKPDNQNKHYNQRKRRNQTNLSISPNKQVVCFAKSDAHFKPYTINGIPVKSIYDLKKYYKKALFLLAVGDSYMPELLSVVKALKIQHYIDAKRIYADSYRKNNFILYMRKLRNIVYLQLQSKKYLPIISAGTIILQRFRYSWLSPARRRTNKTESLSTHLATVRQQNHKTLTATHITYCLAQNAGDTALSWCVRKFLHLRRWNIINVTQPVDQQMIHTINQSDLLIIGGGGLFLPDTNANSASGWQWAIRNSQIEKITCPVVLFSVGYNYFHGQEATERFRSSLNCIIEKASFVGLRNMGSVSAVKSLVKPELKDKITYQPCPTTLIRKIYRVHPKKHTKIVVFNVAFDRESRRYGSRQAIILTQIAKAAVWIMQKGYDIIYAAHCDDDLKFLHYLDRAHVTYKVRNLTQSLPYEIIRFYRKAEVVIGMRGHAQMIPFGLGVKIISLGTHSKMRWFLEDVRLEQCFVDLNTDCSTIASRIIHIFTNIAILYAKEMERHLKVEQDRLWKISCGNRKSILECIPADESHTKYYF